MQPGEIVAGRFEIESRASSGGMGAVFRTKDRTTGALVALKVLHGAWGESMDRFTREALVLSDLKHPGIVKYVAHGMTPAGEAYLAMEWLEGEELSKRLAREGLTVHETLRLARRVAEALAVAHARGVVHRDIKPSNLLLRDKDVDQAILLDFGVARLVEMNSGLTRTGMLLGTPGYMSPEQARGQRNVDARADVFALGAVLFKCLTGQAAFAGDGVIAQLAKVLFDDVPRVRDVRREVPAPLDELVSRMLDKDPEERPPNGQAIVQELEALRELLADLTAEDAVRAPASMRETVITSGEQRLVSVVLAAVDYPRVDTVRARLREAAVPFGATVEVLANGAVIATLRGRGAATDQAAQAARCALAMRAAAPEIPLALATARGELNVPTGARAGLGDVIDRAASLLQGGSAVGPRILVDEVTAALLDVRFDVAADAGAHVLRAERGGLDVARTLLGKATACVGRERELASLRGLFDESSAEPVARAVLVTGPAGIGKSRLRYEFVRGLAVTGARAQVWVARGDPMSAGAPFAMLAQALRSALGLLQGEPAEAQQKKLFARVGWRVDAAEARRVSEFLGELLDVPTGDAPSVQLRAARQDAILMGDQMRRAFEDFLAAECAAAPVVLVLEDLHWGDLPTVKFIEAALRNLADLPLMVVALARAEVHDVFPKLWADRGVMEMRLPELTKKAGEKLVREVLGDTVTQERMRAMVERAAGNAFYLEEIIRSVAEGRGDALPDTVLAMLQARLEALPAEARRVLRAASVFGEVFWSGGIKALAGGGEVHVAEWLGELARAELATRRLTAKFPGEDEYVFRHALVREAAYSMLTDADRALAHRLCGAWLESVGETSSATVAEHFERGGEQERARVWYAHAAAQALEGNDFAAALKMADRAASAGAGGAELGEMLAIRAEAHNWRGEFADAKRCGLEAMDLLPRGSTRWYAAAGEVALASSRIGDYAPLAGILRALRELESQDGISASHVVASARAAQQLLGAGEYALVDAVLAHVEALARRAAPDDPGALAWIALARSMRSDPAASMELTETAIEHFEKAGDLRSACMARGNLGDANNQIGCYAEAEVLLADALATAERMGLSNVAAMARVNRGLSLARLGRTDEAIALVTEGAGEMRAQGDVRREGGAWIYLAMIHLASGAPAEARAAIERALAIVRTTPPMRAWGLAVLAEVHRASDADAEALEAAREALRMLEQMGFLDEGESIVRLAWAEALRDAGNLAGFREAIGEAKESLLRRAAAIRSAARRASFLEEVPENARTMALAAE